MKCQCDVNRKCIDSRWDRRGYRRRRFVCRECGDRWTTIEMRVKGRSKGDYRKVLAMELGNVRLLPAREFRIMKDFARALNRVMPGGEGSLAQLFVGQLNEPEVKS